MGNVVKITNPDLISNKELAYDNHFNLIKEKDELGMTTYYIYDTEKRNLIARVQPLNGTDAYVASTDKTYLAKYAITNYEYFTAQEAYDLGYGGMGLLKSVTDPEGNKITYTYDVDGNIKTETNVSENGVAVATYSYNTIGWKTSAWSPLQFKTDYTYDQNSNLIKTVLNDGETTRTTYDSSNRKTKGVLPNQYNSSYDDLANNTYTGDQGTRYVYFPNGKLKEQTDAENNKTSYTYDLYGNIRTETKPNGAVYQYDYDAMNRKIAVYFVETAAATPKLIEEDGYTVLTNGTTQKIQTIYLNGSEKAVTVSTFDYAKRLISQKDPDGSTLLTSYNSNGTIKTTTDKRGNLTYYNYDGLNRLVKKWTPLELNSSPLYTYTATVYDKAGRVTEEQTGKNVVALNAVPTADDMIIKYNDYSTFAAPISKIDPDIGG